MKKKVLTIFTILSLSMSIVPQPSNAASVRYQTEHKMDKAPNLHYENETIYVFNASYGTYFKAKKTDDVVYTTCDVNLRELPNTDSTPAKVLSSGTKLKRIGIGETGWDIVKMDGNIYYSWGKFTEKNVFKQMNVGLTGIRLERANRIAKVCADNWDTYGVLPSVCIAQAFIETGIGTAYNNGNLWGISSRNYGGYSSIENGAIAYLNVINNGYYSGAPFCTDPYTQIRRILNGGYCQPEGAYYNNAVSVINKYNLREYDKLIK